MAKRKAAKRKAVRRKAVTTRRSARRTTRSAGKKRVVVAKKIASRRKTASAVKKTAKGAARKKAASGRRTTASRKTASAPKKVVKKTAATKRSAPVAKKTAAPPRKTAARTERVPTRSAPGLNRERRTIRDDDIVQTPPSSLDFDRSASAARSGRRELRERYAEHTETGPAMTGGDVDADWESAYSVGDEAPGGDNPTPDQDLVDDIGRAVGVEYQDNEELKGEAKISKRDRNRWELDPASSDDWDER